MAKLITKFKYLKPDARQSVGGYAKYIATREGVEKIDESYQLAPSSVKQQQLIEKILEDFPDSKEMLEYEDYLKEPTVGNASEFITRALEDNAYEVMQTKTYADYIATRPRAQRFGSHGLFTDDGVRIKLNEVSDELNAYEGNVWTVIISLRREDAQRLGYNTGERWRDMLRTQTQALAENFKIPMEHLKWYGAFHNESHHPHVHLMVYADEGIKPYLSKQGVMNLRSSFAKDIFAQDLYFVYEKENLFSEFPILCAFQGLLENIFSQADRAFIQKPDHDIVAMVYYFLKKNKRRFEKTKSEVLRKVSRYFPYSDAINESMVKWIEKL